ncbi:cystatin-like [Dysidea avara]|uniref:cystatin-like n=1 Tax=Dysidea avara TaxID=196820 RepID=UPI00332CD960
MLCRIACLVVFVVAGVSANFTPGGPSQIDDVTDESVVAAADFAVTEMNKRSNSEYKLVRSNIVGGTMQIVAGVKYTLLLEVGLSHCHNDYKPSTLEECPLVKGAKQYQVVVWVEPTNPLTYHLLDDGFKDASGKDVRDVMRKAYENAGYTYKEEM